MSTGSSTNLERPVDIKLQVKTPTRLITEIVGSAPCSGTLVKAWLIKVSIIILFGILHREVSIAERYEHHRLTIRFLRIEIHWQWQFI